MLQTEFLQLVSDILKIPMPKLSYDTSGFASPTQKGATDGECIYIKRDYADPLDMFFVIAHESRHIYQVQNNMLTTQIDRKDYTSSEYNLLASEIDANAFASLMMLCIFQRMPLFNGVDAETVDKIKMRLEELKNIYCTER